MSADLIRYDEHTVLQCRDCWTVIGRRRDDVTGCGGSIVVDRVVSTPHTANAVCSELGGINRAALETRQTTFRVEPSSLLRYGETDRPMHGEYWREIERPRDSERLLDWLASV